MVKACIHIVLILFTIQVMGQNKLEADWPRATLSPELVKGNHFQAEIGFRREKLADHEFLLQHPAATFRYGLFNALELRIGLSSQTIKNDVSKESKRGLKPVVFGVKAKILPEYNGWPSVGVLAQVGIPSLSSNDYFDRRLPLEFRTLFSNSVNQKFKIRYNGGVSWHSGDKHSQWMYTVNPVYQITDHINVFIEEYAFLRNGIAAEHYIDGGAGYYLTKNFLIDLSAGVGLSNISSRYFLSAGFSFRLPVDKHSQEEDLK